MGHGEVIGARQQSAGDWDGFLTIVDAANGSIDGEQMGSYHTHSKRIKTQLEKDDLVMGLCMDGDKAYVVGSTEGKVVGTEAGGAFVMKIDIGK